MKPLFIVYVFLGKSIRVDARSSIVRPYLGHDGDSDTFGGDFLDSGSPGTL
jgi:hypothetical protein